MAFTYLQNYINSGVGITTDDAYRDLTQAFIDQQWDNTSAKTPENGGALSEQSDFGSNEYVDIEVWLAPIVADTSTGLKYPEDFLKLIFKDINHTVQRGLMYQYNNEYWIAYSYASFDGLPQSVGIRRCNNVLRIVDPENGSIFQIPCVVDYDMLAPTPQVSRYIITPNSHAVVMVQGNVDTWRLFKLNTRYILGGRPFKLYAYQNTIKYNATDDNSTLLYLDLYLDEIHANDDIENQIAYNGDYDYSIVIHSPSSVRYPTRGNFYASVLLNGQEVDRNIIWSSNANNYLAVEQDGAYVTKQLFPRPSMVAVVNAELQGNENINSNIRVKIQESSYQDTYSVFLFPTKTTLRQYESITFQVYGISHGILYTSPENITVGTISANNLDVVLNDDKSISVVANNIGNATLTLSHWAVNGLTIEEQALDFQVVSMMG